MATFSGQAATASFGNEIDLLFKSNYEVIFCLTKDMNNLIHIRGVADFDDDLEDIKAVSWLLDY